MFEFFLNINSGTDKVRKIWRNKFYVEFDETVSTPMDNKISKT